MHHRETTNQTVRNNKMEKIEIEMVVAVMRNMFESHLTKQHDMLWADRTAIASPDRIWPTGMNLSKHVIQYPFNHT